MTNIFHLPGHEKNYHMIINLPFDNSYARFQAAILNELNSIILNFLKRLKTLLFKDEISLRGLPRVSLLPIPGFNTGVSHEF